MAVALGNSAQDRSERSPGLIPSAHFTGMIDEVGLYRRALTANEIWALADADVAGKDLASPYLVAPSLLPSVALGADYHHTSSCHCWATPANYPGVMPRRRSAREST